MLERLLIEIDMFSVFLLLWIGKEKTRFFDIKCHDSYLMKCLHNNISQNDTSTKLYSENILRLHAGRI